MRTEKARDKRHLALDGIRGVALLCIFAHHSVTHQLSSSVRDTGVGFWGGMVSELRLSLISFFVLSGFLLYTGFAKALRERSELRLGQYFKRRAARVFPAYYVAILGSIALLWGAQMPNLNLPTTGELPLFAVLGQNYTGSTLEALNGPTWTLVVEAAFYLMLPLLGVLLWRFHAGPRAQLAVLGGLLLFGSAWRLPVFDDNSEVWAKALPAFLPYFAVGMMLALWNVHRDRTRWFSRPATIALVIGAAGLVVFNGLWHLAGRGGGSALLDFTGDLPAALGFALLIAAVIAGAGGRFINWLSWRPLVGLGVVSYGFYLWHLPIMLFWRRLGIEGGFLETAALTFPVALAFAIASWKLLESPILRWSHKPSEKRRPEPARRQAPVVRPTPAVRPRSVRPSPVSVSDLT